MKKGIKKNLKKVILTFIFVFTSILFINPTSVLADTKPYTFGYSAYSCSGTTENDFYGCIDKYYAGKTQLKPLANNSTVDPGTNIMLAFEYSTTITDKTKGGVGFQLRTEYKYSDATLLTYTSGTKTNNALFDGVSRDNPVFEDLGRSGIKAWTTDLSISDAYKDSRTKLDGYGLLTLQLDSSTGSDRESLYSGSGSPYKSGALYFAFFKIKDDVKGGTIVKFEVDTTEGIGTIITNNDSDRIDFEPGSISFKVAGEAQSNDTSLSDITFTGSNGIKYTATYDETNKKYKLTVPAAVTSLTIDATATDSNASFLPYDSATGNKFNRTYDFSNKYGNIALDAITTDGDKISAFTVTAQNGSDTAVYNVDVYRLSDDATLSNLTAIAGGNNLGLTFDSTTSTYTGSVPFAVYKITSIKPVTTHDKATLKDGATSDLTLNADTVNYGATETTKTITVNAENCDSKYANLEGNTCTTKDYTLKVNRAAPEQNADLKDLKVGLTPDSVTTIAGFDKDTTEYTYGPIAYSETPSISVAATRDSTLATLTGTGTISLKVGDNVVPVTVTAQGGSKTKTYNIHVRVKSNDNRLKDLTVTTSPTSGSPLQFAKEKNNYTYNYPSDTTQITISATTDHDKAEITGFDNVTTNVDGTKTGTKTIASVSNKTFSFNVTSENGDIETYTIAFSKILSENNKLASLSADGVTLDKAFNADTNLYSGSVDGTVTSVNVSATLADSNNAKFVDSDTSCGADGDCGPRTVGLHYGLNNIYVKVKSEKGDVNSYTLQITRKYNTIATLDAIYTDYPNADTRVSGFSSSKEGTYEISVPFEKDSIKVTADLTDKIVSDDTDRRKESYTVSNADASSNVKLKTGENTITVTTTAQDGTTHKTYTLKVTRAKNNDTSITSAYISKNNTTYAIICTDQDNLTSNCSVTVPNSVESINPSDVVVVPTDNTSTSYDGVATVTKQAGTTTLETQSNQTNIFNFTVTAEDGTTKKNYIVTITREKSTDNTLGSVSVTPNTGDKDKQTCNTFSNFECNITVPTETTTYTIDLAPSSKAAKVELKDKDGNTLQQRTFDMGGSTESVQKYTVMVTPEEGTQQSYTLTITRDASSNADLKSLSVITNIDSAGNKEYATITPVFSAKETDYKAEVSGTVSTVTLDAAVVDTGKASISSTDLGIKNLDYGSNRFKITVTAEKGNTKDYYITITRKNNIDATLKNIKVGGYDLEGFTSDKTTYNYDDKFYDDKGSSNQLKVSYGTTSINIVPYVNDEGKATYTINDKTDNQINLKTGKNTISILVKAHDTSVTKTYILNIYRGLNTTNSIDTITVGGVKAEAYTKDDETRYRVTVPNDVTFANSTNVVVTLPKTAALYDTPATVGIADVSSLSTKNVNDLKITVTPESGDIKTYHVDITRTKSSVNTLKNVTVTGIKSDGKEVDGAISPAFTSEDVNKSYSVSFPNDVVRYRIDYTKGEDNETVEGAGTHELDGTKADNANVTITPEIGAGDNNKNVNTLTFTVSRSASTITTLDDITVSVGDKVYNLYHPNTENHVFKSGTTKGYTVDLPGGTSDAIIKVSKTDSRSRVEGQGVLANTDLVSGASVIFNGKNSYIYDIRVYAENSESAFTDYEFTVNVLAKKDATLKELKINDEDSILVDDKYSYTLNAVENNVSTLNISATTNDSDARIASVGGITYTDANKSNSVSNVSIPLQIGDNAIEIIVAAEDGTTQKYTVNVNREKNSIAKLTNLSVNGYSIGNFDEDKTEYYVDDVKAGTLSIKPDDIIAESNYNASITKAGDTPLATGSRIEYDIYVKSEDGKNNNTYKIFFTRKADTNNLLKSISLTGATIEPATFSSANDTYTLKIPRKTSEFTISGEAQGFNAVVTGCNTYNGDTKQVKLVVTPEDKNAEPKTYTFNVVTDEAQNNYLSSLEVQGYDMNPGFGKETEKYVITDDIVIGTKELKINASAENADAKIMYCVSDKTNCSDNQIVTLPQAIGNTQKLFVKVIPASGIDGNSKYYEIDYNMVESSNTYLKSLKTDAYDNTLKKDILSPEFSKGAQGYDTTVSYNVQSITFTLVTEDRNSKVSVNGGNYLDATDENPFTYTASNLPVGTTHITFAVKAPNDSADVREYTVNIQRQNKTPSKDATLSNLAVKGFKLSPEFDATSTNRTFDIGKVPFKTTSLEINAKINNNAGKINYFLNGNPVNSNIIDLANAKAGDNTIVVQGVAEDRTVTDSYTITFNRKASDNAYLGNLTVTPDLDNQNKITNFNKDTSDYKVSLAEGTNNVTVYAEAEDKDVKQMSINGSICNTNTCTYSIGINKLSYGDNKIPVIVTSEAETEKTYWINLYKEGTEVITSKTFGHVIDNGFIKTVKIDTTVLEMKNQLDNENRYLQVWDKNETKELTANDKVTTGTIVKLIINGKECDRKIIVIKGDTNSDGEISLIDAVRVVNHYSNKQNNTKQLAGAELVAADTKEDNEISLIDAVRIVNHYSGNTNLFE